MKLTSDRCPLCDLREAAAGGLLTKVCEAYLWESGGPNCAKTYQDLVSILEIEAFTELEPTIAHFFLAFLAREGLVTEFVTTNYDCNLEDAYRATWSPRQSGNTPAVCSIYDLRSFALNAAHSSTWSPGEDTAHPLKVFKLNGCAARLKSEPSHARDILLTSSQLQDWRARRWAADFFRTKVRTACLVTIGFGSDEPQVVHTLQQVVEEFSGWGDGVAGNSAASVFDAANAPVVTIYGPYPTFQQLQLVYGFSSWLTGDPRGGDELVIGPKQRARLDLSSDNTDTYVELSPLSADELWRDVFQLIFIKLLIRQMRGAAVAENAAFTSAIPHANTLLTLIGEELQANFKERLQPSNYPVHWLAELEDALDGTTAQPPYLTQCVTHLLGKSDIPGRYTAVSDYGSLYSELILLLVLLQSKDTEGDKEEGVTETSREREIWRKVSLRQPSTLEFMLPMNEEGGPPIQPSVFVSRAISTPYFEASDAARMGGGAKRVEIVLGSSGRRLLDLDRRSFSYADGGRSPVALVRLDWKVIFSPEFPIRSYQDLGRRIRDAIAFPTKYRRRQDTSLKTNRFLERSYHD
ncbi:SIR2 family protein [Paraburkholderia aspalathi]|uniref:SIR2 family protein n=1 Tax=Paraburkholderia aspalathi TaxID=1324617 RepID=UPI0038BCC71B